MAPHLPCGHPLPKGRGKSYLFSLWGLLIIPIIIYCTKYILCVIMTQQSKFYMPLCQNLPFATPLHRHLCTFVLRKNQSIECLLIYNLPHALPPPCPFTGKGSGKRGLYLWNKYYISSMKCLLSYY